MCGECRQFPCPADLRRADCRSGCKSQGRIGGRMWCCEWLTLTSRRRRGTSGGAPYRDQRWDLRVHHGWSTTGRGRAEPERRKQAIAAPGSFLGRSISEMIRPWDQQHELPSVENRGGWQPDSLSPAAQLYGRNRRSLPSASLLPDGSALYGVAGGGAFPSFGMAFKFDKARNSQSTDNTSSGSVSTNSHLPVATAQESVPRRKTFTGVSSGKVRW
jgi:hypothetical protein